jgi:anion-transporting  ArsA/GET3 family ATPase
MSSPLLDVDALLDDPAIRILVCCGSGGVGKTTTSAALALRAADRGRRVAVLTIDPARRLADALGVAALGDEPRPVDPAVLAAGGLEVPGSCTR